MIDPVIIQRFERLRDMATLAVATTDGLRPALDHARDEAQRMEMHFQSVARDYGGKAEVVDGRAVVTHTAEHRIKDAAGERTVWEPRQRAVPELDGHAVPLQRARERHAQLRGQFHDAGARASALRRLVGEARSALIARGWREAR